MKKIILFIMGVGFFFFLPQIILAASFSISASTKEVSPNSSFTISVGGDAIGRVNLSVKNGSLSTSSVWVEQNRQTVTVKAGASGNVVVTATPEKGFSDADANEYNPGARSVTVSIVSKQSNTKPSQPNNTKPSTNTQKPSVSTPKSSNNLLSSLTIHSGNLNPSFQSEVEEYSINFSHDVTSITIEGSAADQKAKIEGLGEKKLTAGENEIKIVVTAENGEKKTYRIKAYVEELPEVYLNYHQESIGILKNMQGVSVPDGLEKKEITKDDKTIFTYANEHFSLVYGMNSNEEKGFYLYDEETGRCKSKIIPVKLMNQNFYITDLEHLEGFEQSSFKIQDQEVLGYQFSNEMEQYFLLSLLNSKGEMINYLYEKSEGTLQLYSDEALQFYQKQSSLIQVNHKQQILIGVFGILFVLLLIILFFLCWKRKERKHEKSN